MTGPVVKKSLITAEYLIPLIKDGREYYEKNTFPVGKQPDDSILIPGSEKELTEMPLFHVFVSDPYEDTTCDNYWGSYFDIESAINAVRKYELESFRYGNIKELSKYVCHHVMEQTFLGLETRSTDRNPHELYKKTQ